MNDTEQLIHDLKQLGRYSDLEPNYWLLAVEKIEELSGKQIPKKVEVYDDDCRADCPVCGHTFENNVNDWGCKYCQDCGQALDWSDGE